MPVFLQSGRDGEEWVEATAKTGKELLEEIYKTYEAAANEFRTIPSKTVNALESVYVIQREFAVVPVSHADSGIPIVGSDDATTCHILIVRSPGGGVVSVGHFDEADTPNQLATFLDATVSTMRESASVDTGKPMELDVYIIGGFTDNSGTSERISIDLLWLLHTQPSTVLPAGTGTIKCHLKLACLSKLNTVTAAAGQRNQAKAGAVRPALFGAAVDLKSGDVFPCTFENRGPEAPLRFTRVFSDQYDLMNVYNPKTKRVTIDPFPYFPIGGAEDMINQPDEWILQNMSTSPDSEPPHFASSVRDMLKFTIQNPDWRKVFADGPIEFEQRSGQGWVRVAKP